MRINYTEKLINTFPGDDLGSVKLFIGIPCKDGMVNHVFADSLMNTVIDLRDKGIEVVIKYHLYEGIISRARNFLADDFINSDCTHFLQIDVDQGWNADCVYKMLQKKVDFICGAVPVNKKDGYNLVIYTQADRTPVVKDDMLMAEYCGTGFMMVTKTVFNRLKVMYPGLQRKEYWSFFDFCYDEEGKFYSEDVSFCLRWGKYEDIFIYPDIDFIHVKDNHIKGNYHKFLLSQPSPEDWLEHNIKKFLEPKETYNVS